MRILSLEHLSAYSCSDFAITQINKRVVWWETRLVVSRCTKAPSQDLILSSLRSINTLHLLYTAALGIRKARDFQGWLVEVVLRWWVLPVKAKRDRLTLLGLAIILYGNLLVDRLICNKIGMGFRTITHVVARGRVSFDCLGGKDCQVGATETHIAYARGIYCPAMLKLPLYSVHLILQDFHLHGEHLVLGLEILHWNGTFTLRRGWIMI